MFQPRSLRPSKTLAVPFAGPLILVLCGSSGCITETEPSDRPEVLARFEPSQPEIIAAMLDLAQVTPKDIVYDLGCGDGRILIEAARRGAHGVGVDLDPELIAAARSRAGEAGLGHLLELRVGDLLQADIAPATVVTLFLSRRGNSRVEKMLRTRLAPGTRIVSHCHAFDDWDPEKTVIASAAGREHTIYLWTVRGGETAASLGPYVRTPMPVVRKMLDLAEVGPGDVVYDLGCGDGRIVIEAAKVYGARGVGIDFDLDLCKEAREWAEREGIAGRVEIRHEDLATSDFSDATVVALYLLPKSNELLRPRLEALKPGTRIVAHDFAVGDWKPLKSDVLWLNDAERHTVYLWRVGE